MSKLDATQVLQQAYDDSASSLRVSATVSGGSFVTEDFDEVDLTYVASGNGVGEVQTATYKLAGSTVATLTFTYNSDNKLATVTKA